MGQCTADVEVEAYRVAFEDAATPMVMFDLETRRCLHANAAAERAYG